ncbi:MAG: ferritin-like domain-containing protein [Bacteroidota bacterium]|nr:ferritin-like domain-containing protein [Bacteroidota bacterium]MDP4191310.1 ferritin-like domain-containing protein [Bacteroidota bacterium]MDP4195171.1 ferritin-like domain-containing protein [Bacteroidota bacterium]
MQIDSLKKLYISELQDIFSAENQILEALPKMVNQASSRELKNALNEHLDMTKKQIGRLKEIFKNMNENPSGQKCKGMEGIIQEGEQTLQMAKDPEVKNALIIASAQRVEHYEISAYGTVRTYAEIIGDEDARDLLQNTLEEEKETDKKLTELAVNSINVETNK